MGLPDIDNIPDTGAVFTLGRSRFADNIASHFFIRKDPVAHISCGDEHSAVVCQSGRLFVFGSNDWGQLGLGHKNHVSKPSCVKILKPERVTHVSCGRAHTLICTGNQKIFACGSDQESQLGRDQQSVGDSSSSPILIYDCGLGGSKIRQVAAGSHHSLALTSDGGVLAWGSNLEGQLGLSGISGLINKPTKVHLPEPIKQISAGYYHSAFLTENGNIYVCGEAESGKLGIALDFRTQVAPKQMPLPVSASVISCGGHHTLILGDNGNIYCTGSNASGQLGMGVDVTEIQTPKELPRDANDVDKIIKMVCGESHIAIITECGKLFTCGDGRHGKLGLEENENNVYELTHATKYQELIVTNVSCGGCHTILVGQRRSEELEIEDPKQMKINSLPPLKVPSARIPHEIQAKSEYSIEEAEKGENEPTEKISKITSDLTDIAIYDAVDDNGVEKLSRSPMESPKFEMPAAPRTPTPVNETVESIMKNDDTEVENNERLENLNNENDEKKVTAAIIETIERPKSSKSYVNTGNNNEQTEKGEDMANDEVIAVEKPSTPPLLVPPLKPPRQKLGSADSNTSNKSSSTTIVSPPSPRNESEKSSDPNSIETKDKEPPPTKRPVKINDNDEKSEGNKSASSDKSCQSTKSGAGTDETVTIESKINNTLVEIENVKDKTVEVIEEKIDMIADDTDVVQSPIIRASGKMAKLFKGKRQEEENGPKLSCIPNPKAKSKTCSIL